MKKAFLLATAFVVAVLLTVGVCAEDVTDTSAVTEDISAETAVDTEEVVEETTDAEETIVGSDEPTTSRFDDLRELLDEASPQQVENIKKYIEYGVNSLPIGDRVKLIVIDYIDVIAWLVAAISFLVFFVFGRISEKKLDDNAKTMTQNAIEIAEEGKKELSAARDEMSSIRDDICDRIRAESDEVKSMSEQTLKRMDEHMAAILDVATDKMVEAEAAMSDAARKESGLTEATAMLCEVVGYLVEHSHSLPEWERDKMTCIIADGKKKIEEVTADDQSHEE